VWALTGPGPNPLAELADEVLTVAAPSTSVIQEVHLMLLHAVCAAVDARLAPRPGDELLVPPAGQAAGEPADEEPATVRAGVA
jgi:type III pantothenate kinase